MQEYLPDDQFQEQLKYYTNHDTGIGASVGHAH
jgi:hypothetical protein